MYMLLNCAHVHQSILCNTLKNLAIQHLLIYEHLFNILSDLSAVLNMGNQKFNI